MWDHDNRLHNPTTKLMFADGVDFTANAIGKKSQTVQCAIENSDMVNFLKKLCYARLKDFFHSSKKI